MNLEAQDRLAAVLHPIVERQGLRSYARSIRVSSGTVSRWLQRESFPDGDNRLKVAKSLGMTMDEFNRKILEGQASSTVDPVDQVISLIMSLPPPDLARIQRAIADRIEAFTATRQLNYSLEEAESSAPKVLTLQ